MKKNLLFLFLLFLVKNGNAQLTDWLPLADQHYGGTSFAQSSNGSKIYKGTYGDGVYMSSDFGNTWQSIYPSLIRGAHSIAIRRDTLFACIGGCGALGIQYTANDGQLWTRIDNGFVDTLDAYQIAVNQTTLFIACSKGVFKTDDLGKSWQVYYTSLYSGGGGFSVCTDGNNICVGSLGKILVSNDNGNSWRETIVQGVSGSVAWVVYIKGNTLFAGFGKGLYRSLNNGESWTRVGLPGRNVISFDLFGNYAFAGTDYGYSGIAEIFFSTDSGTTWSQSNFTPPSARGVWGFEKIGNKIISGGWSDGMWFADLATGRNSVSSKDLRVFPNPARDFLRVVGNVSVPADFSLFNIVGEKVLQIAIKKMDDTINIEIANLASGAYLWKLATKDQQLYTGRVLIDN